MLVLGIILGLFVLFLLFLVLMPLRLEVSSSRQFVCLSIPPLAEVHIHWDAEEPQFGFRVFFWRKEWRVIQMILKEPKKKKEQKVKEELKPQKRKRIKPKRQEEIKRFVLRKWKKNWAQLINSFKVNNIYVNVDTNDFVLNAYLYPVMFFLSHYFRRPLAINFHGKTEIELDMVNRPIWVIMAFLR